MNFKAPLAAVLVAVLVACSTVTRIDSNPSGAAVNLNGMPVGQTPLTMTLSDGVWRNDVIEVSLPGYQTQVMALQRNLNVGRLIIGIFLWWPELFWVLDHNPAYMVNLQASQGGMVEADAPEAEDGAVGYLAVKSEDDAITVSVGGEEISPSRVSKLPAGDHTLTLSQGEIEMGTMRVHITDGQLTQLYLAER